MREVRCGPLHAFVSTFCPDYQSRHGGGRTSSGGSLAGRVALSARCGNVACHAPASRHTAQQLRPVRRPLPCRQHTHACATAHPCRLMRCIHPACEGPAAVPASLGRPHRARAGHPLPGPGRQSVLCTGDDPRRGPHRVGATTAMSSGASLGCLAHAFPVIFRTQTTSFSSTCPHSCMPVCLFGCPCQAHAEVLEAAPAADEQITCAWLWCLQVDGW